jgi:hypothetical protein
VCTASLVRPRVPRPASSQTAGTNLSSRLSAPGGRCGWTLWVDGNETLTLDMKRSDVEKESINFIGFGPFLLDDIVIEDLPRP